MILGTIYRVDSVRSSRDRALFTKSFPFSSVSYGKLQLTLEPINIEVFQGRKTADTERQEDSGWLWRCCMHA